MAPAALQSGSPCEHCGNVTSLADADDHGHHSLRALHAGTRNGCRSRDGRCRGSAGGDDHMEVKQRLQSVIEYWL